MAYLLVGVLVGCLSPVQTAVNGRLRQALSSPFRSSMVSYAVGTAALAAVVLTTGPYPLVPDAAASAPWWMWLPGAFGVVFLTGNILLLPKLGSLQTVALPVLGQVAMALMVDQFGWFGSDVHEMTPVRAFGALAVGVGFFVAIVLDSVARSRAVPDHAASRVDPPAARKWPWQLAGIAFGMSSAAQTAILGQLGGVLGSPVKATLVSFVLGLAILAVIVGVRERTYSLRPALAAGQPRWMWAGGLVGAVYVFFLSYLSPILGAGLTVIVMQVGQLAGGFAIDTFGLLGVAKRRISVLQVAGLLIACVGAGMIRLG